MTWDEAVVQAREDYDRVLGTTLTVATMYGYAPGSDDTQELRSDAAPLAVRVLATNEYDIRRDMDGWLDPIWNVEPVDPEATTLRCCWIYGRSYRYEKRNK